MTRLSIPQIEGAPVAPALFGGNFLADRYPLSGKAGGIEDQIDRIGIDGLRYPGGALTERLFDIRSPDKARVTDDGGEARDFVPLSDFLSYAADEDHAVTIVIPTRENLSSRTDSTGDRFPAFNEDDLRDFVRDVANGKYGDADIAAFEIGNEYWGSGQMTAVEYGRLSSRMADIIDDEMTAITLETGEDPSIDILVQSGTNNGHSNLSEQYEGQPPEAVIEALNDRFGTDLDADDRTIVFFGGRINWRGVNDELVLREFSAEERGAVDGVVTHIYSKETVSPGHRDFGLTQVQRSWGEEFPDIDIHVTEWNQSAADPRLKDDEDYGLHQAHEVLDTLESMISAGVEQAHIWPLVQNSRNALAPDAAGGDLSPTGELFALMSDALPGKSLLDFAPQDTGTTEGAAGATDLHGYYGGGEMVLYLASSSDRIETASYDLTQMIAGGGTARATLLGVTDARDTNSVDARPTLEEIPAESFYDNGSIVATLAPGEIMQVRLTDFRPTDALGQLMDQIDGTAPPQEADIPDPLPPPQQEEPPILPSVPAPVFAEDDNAQDEVQQDDDDDMFDNLGWLLMLLPFLAMGGFA